MKPGQLLKIVKSLFGIDDSFLIESVTVTQADYGKLNYAISALDGEAIGGWEEFFKQVVFGQKTFAIAENEVLVLLNTPTEAEGWSGTLTIGESQALYPSDTLYPSNTLYPNNSVTEEALYD